MKPLSVTLQQMLDARERRAREQSALLRQADADDCLVSFSLNIAGDVKRTPKTRRSASRKGRGRSPTPSPAPKR